MLDWASLATMTQNSKRVLHGRTGMFKIVMCATRDTAHVCMKDRNASLTRSMIACCLPFLVASLMAGAIAITLGCATPHATLSFTAPSTVTAAVPFSVTVNVIYQGKPDTVINNRVHFSSSDPAAVLPGDYYFTPADGGSHTWTNGFTLSTTGNQTISGKIIEATGINGNATIAVSP